MFKQFVTQASAAELAEKHYSDIDTKLVQHALSIDPSRPNPDGDLSKPMGDYARQLLAWERKDPFLGDSGKSNQVEGLLEKYVTLRKYLPPEYQNINKFPTMTDFADFMLRGAEEAAKKQRLDKATKESSVFYEDDDWIVRIPKTYFASNYFGNLKDENGGYSTHWCTTYDPRHYNHYAPYGVLLMILNKETPAKSCQLYIARDQNSDRPFEIKRYGDGGTDAGAIPPPIREKILEKFSFDTVEKLGLEEELWDTEAEGSHGEEFWRYECRAELNYADGEHFVRAVVGVEIQEHIYDDGDLVDIDYTDSVGAEMIITRFDYRKSEPESLATLDTINPTADMGMVVLVNGSGFDSGDAPMHAWQEQNYGNATPDVVARDFYEVKSEMEAYMGQLMAFRDGRKLESWDARIMYRTATGRAGVPFILFLCKQEIKETDDLFDIENSFPGRGRGLEDLDFSNGFVYDGVRYPYVVAFNNDNFGTLEDALQDEKFAAFMSGQWTSSPDQEESDRQLKFEFEGIEAAKRMFAARKAAILAAAKARRA